MNVSWDDLEFQARMARLTPELKAKSLKALDDIATELLRLSQVEVPLDTGHLQNSGEHHMDGETAVVGYHTPYAAKMHEHPEYNFQNGRKGKYLEDPLKQNLGVFREFFIRRMREAFNA